MQAASLPVAFKLGRGPGLSHFQAAGPGSVTSNLKVTVTQAQSVAAAAAAAGSVTGLAREARVRSSMFGP